MSLVTRNIFESSVASFIILLLLPYSSFSFELKEEVDNQLSQNNNNINNHKFFIVDFLNSKITPKVLVISALSTITLIAVSHLIVQPDFSSSTTIRKYRQKLTDLSSIVMEGLNYGRNKINNSRFQQPGLNLRDPEYKKAYDVALRCGIIGGLVNDGNTCFMNSVLQSLASSNEFMEFLEEYTSKPNETANLKFSTCLRNLLSKINERHYNSSVYYKTKPLMKLLASNGPQRNLIMGYDQEDAQEFYQMVLKELEKEYVKTLPGYTGEESQKREPSPSSLFTDLTDDMIYGLQKLGEIGEVYVPASQIDPNYPNPEGKVYPLKLVTPVDGLSLERIGCTQCGEIGGIRYSLISGLSLNLQLTSKGSYTLEELLEDWILPEIIDDVECNRCGLMQMCKILEQQIASQSNEKLARLMNSRLQEIKDELSKPIISDEAYKKLHTKNHIQKSKKIKQIFFSRPPPLLTIHVNRSVFDPRTYMIRKNGAQVNFPMKLDLSPFVVECDDINMDARLAFRKQDEELLRKREKELSENVPTLSSTEEEEEEIKDTRPKYDSLGNDIEYSDDSASDEEEEDSHSNEDYLPPNLNRQSNTFSSDLQQPSPPESIESEKVIETPAGPLTYSLKSIISHFGTHNYGHYIAYRKYRGIWWRVSDETVRVTTESEVLNTSGVFMLFYELSTRNDIKDGIPDMSADEQKQDVPMKDGGSDDEFKPETLDEEESEDEEEGTGDESDDGDVNSVDLEDEEDAEIESAADSISLLSLKIEE